MAVMSRSRSFHTASVTPVGNSASYSVIINVNNVIVGELVGNAQTIGSTVPVSASNPLTLCLDILVNIDQNVAAFPVADFATVSANGGVGNPLNLAITFNPVGWPQTTASQFCATVTTTGTYFPVIHRSDWATATSSASATKPVAAIMAIAAMIVSWIMWVA